MCHQIDWTNATKQIADFKEHPSGAMMNADFNEFRILAFEAAQVAYRDLTEKLESQPELKNLFFDHNMLMFVFYEFDNMTVSDVDEGRKRIFKYLLNEVPETVSQQIESMFERSDAKEKLEPRKHDGAEEVEA